MPPPDPDRFRAAMASLPTGVTIVSASGADGPAGATANAVCSLSIEPMLMLACLDRGSRTLLAVQAADRFGISVLHAGQEPIARAFATKAPVAEKWAGVAWSERDGIPAIDDALAWLACDLRDVIAAGDHVIVTGEVRALETSEGDPLVFHGGEYRPLRLSAGAQSQPVAIASALQTSCMRGPERLVIGSVRSAARHLPEVVETDHAFLRHPVGSPSRTSVGMSRIVRVRARRAPGADRDRLGPSQDQHRPPSLLGHLDPADVAPRHHGSSRSCLAGFAFRRGHLLVGLRDAFVALDDFAVDPARSSSTRYASIASRISAERERPSRAARSSSRRSSSSLSWTSVCVRDDIGHMVANGAVVAMRIQVPRSPNLSPS